MSSRKYFNETLKYLGNFGHWLTEFIKPLFFFKTFISFDYQCLVLHILWSLDKKITLFINSLISPFPYLYGALLK